MGIKGMKWNVRKNDTTELDKIIEEIKDRKHDLLWNIAQEAERKENYDLLDLINKEYDFLNSIEAGLELTKK